MNVWFCVKGATLTTNSSNFLADPLHLSLLLPAHTILLWAGEYFYANQSDSRLHFSSCFTGRTRLPSATNNPRFILLFLFLRLCLMKGWKSVTHSVFACTSCVRLDCDLCDDVMGSTVCLQTPMCPENVCYGSLMMPNQHAHKPEEVRSKEELLKLATDFIDQYYTSIKRWAQSVPSIIHYQK